MKKTIFISAGSSGGHIFPAITLAKKLRKLNHEVYFVATPSRIEGSILPNHGFDILPVTSPVVRKPFKGFTKFIFEILRSIKESRVHVKQYKPDMIISFGGAVSFSIGIVSFLSRIPLFVHEQNAVLGLSNQWVALFAKKLLTQFELKSKFFQHKIIHVGSPRTSEFIDYQFNHNVYASLNLDQKVPLVVFVMGSLGSYTMQKMIKNMIEAYPNPNYQRLVITGTRFYEEFKHLNTVSKQTIVLDTISLIDLYPYINLLVTRAGATTMAELLGARIPSILIPSPYVTRNHQFLNANYFLNHQASIVLDERNLDEHILMNQIDNLMSHPQHLLAMRHQLESMSDLSELDRMLECLPL
jgi:UDP-N-acetylglucosamine--N-acetylmuramyl-(pentapeptide) pyrophosphoryl-undecaprenol N-acetylglucosamine transferase